MTTATKELLELKKLKLEEIPLNQRQHMGGMLPFIISIGFA